MIRVKSHISVGTPTDFCQDVARLTDEHGISTVVFPWDTGTTHPSAQLARVEKLMETTQPQVCCVFDVRPGAGCFRFRVAFIENGVGR